MGTGVHPSLCLQPQLWSPAEPRCADDSSRPGSDPGGDLQARSSSSLQPYGQFSEGAPRAEHGPAHLLVCRWVATWPALPESALEPRDVVPQGKGNTHRAGGLSDTRSLPLWEDKRFHTGKGQEPGRRGSQSHVTECLQWHPGGPAGVVPRDTRTHSDPEEGDTNQKNPTRTWLPPTEEPLKRLCPNAPRTAPPALESCNTPNVSQAPQDCADVTLRPPVPPAALSSASAKEEPDNRTHVKI